MKRRYLFLWVVILMVVAGCGKGDDPLLMVPLSSQKAITAFSINEVPGVISGASAMISMPNGVSAIINETAKTIALTMPFGTDVTNLVATFTTTGASVHVGGTLQESGETPNDFTNPVTYTVTAADSSKQDYTVTVTVEPADHTSDYIGILKYVPAGSFQRDGTEGNISVISKPFRMSQHEITRAQFLSVMGADPSNTTYSTGTSDPVQWVNWYHAIAFCNKLSLLEELTPVYSVTGVDFSTLTYAEIPTNWNETWNAVTANWSANGYRLPTEMEWMWASMGATSALGYTPPTYLTGYAKPFAGSDGTNAIGDYAWYSANSGSTTHPVGTKLPNELGLYDMSGNVWEWCWDWFAVYPAGELTDYRGAASGTYRVGRGGSWRYDAAEATVAHRYYDYPVSQVRYLGFRVVRP